MEVDSDSDDYDDDEDLDFVYYDHLGDFFKKLDMSQITLAFRDFSFSKNKVSDSSMVLGQSGLTSLGNSLTTIRECPTSMDTALAIPQMWHNIINTTADIERRHLESCILRACIMWAALSLNMWVENTIDRVQSGKANKSWVNKLVSQIDNALNSKAPVGTEIILRSEDFLAQLPPTTYKWSKPRFTYDTKTVKERIKCIAHDSI
ncbi:uncharacterized protein LACBIDRAFT_302736 [Laccaria bicolor S238N-H82]|uniref:Predicted protein n=1 Tax=Laccaria bicolor (strain S238N-H82 / ATCC MYA-4686) TaxID=486041 RepID=B0DI62_LACBS|nr:uncharacterized protein LACBIDRAFT_302736 [Laccaria bicolor S238N-H82]EDR05522.1 predicted protein [Laccaria bicolor S238N-H82]|eukprot:XP_001883626.1 predicted protein [Laccaria bicolor S238N-H82]